MNLLNIFLMMGGGNGTQGKGGGMETMIMFALIIVVFYFFMIRPQMKRSKQERLFRESLQKGDKVLVLGSMHAKITEVNETTIEVEIAHGVQITVEKQAVSAIPQTPPAKK